MIDQPFVIFLIEKTREYLARVRGVDTIDFKLWFDHEEGLYKAKFDYGRVGSGSKYGAVMEAIGWALYAVEEDL